MSISQGFMIIFYFQEGLCLIHDRRKVFCIAGKEFYEHPVVVFLGTVGWRKPDSLYSSCSHESEEELISLVVSPDAKKERLLKFH